LGNLTIESVAMPYIAHHISRSLVFEPELLLVMGDAYDRSLGLFAKVPSEVVQQAIASQIIVMAERGLSDPATLCRKSLTAFRRLENQFA
jgi:hypothetical protein